MFVGRSGSERRRLRHTDDAGASAGYEMLGHVVHEQYFAALGLHREAVMGLDATLEHEGRIGQDHVGVFVPAVSAVRVSYSAMCGSAKPCRYTVRSAGTMSGEMS